MDHTTGLSSFSQLKVVTAKCNAFTVIGPSYGRLLDVVRGSSVPVSWSSVPVQPKKYQKYLTSFQFHNTHRKSFLKKQFLKSVSEVSGLMFFCFSEQFIQILRGNG
jgi:hypothetical protein